MSDPDCLTGIEEDGTPPRVPLVIRCKKCDKPYRNEAPLLAWVEGKGMQPPEPGQDWWLPDCRCKPRAHYIEDHS